MLHAPRSPSRLLSVPLAAALICYTRTVPHGPHDPESEVQGSSEMASYTRPIGGEKRECEILPDMKSLHTSRRYVRIIIDNPYLQDDGLIDSERNGNPVTLIAAYLKFETRARQK